MKSQDRQALSQWYKRQTLFDAFGVFVQIKWHCDTGTPFSLIRLGDGEGALLGYPELSTRSDVRRSEQVWFGRNLWSDEELFAIVAQLRDAVELADIVGVPRLKQCDIHPLYAVVLNYLKQAELPKPFQRFCHAAIHRQLQFALLYRPLLLERAWVGLISSRDLRTKLCKQFAIGHVELYKIQGEYAFQGEVTTPHYPKSFRHILENLEVPYPGALFLVGAGALGKIYCQVIKQRGGVALDIGALCDAWAEIPSRLIHPCHSLEVYEKHLTLSKSAAYKRYLELMQHFAMEND